MAEQGLSTDGKRIHTHRGTPLNSHLRFEKGAPFTLIRDKDNSIVDIRPLDNKLKLFFWVAGHALRLAGNAYIVESKSPRFLDQSQDHPPTKAENYFVNEYNPSRRLR